MKPVKNLKENFQQEPLFNKRLKDSIQKFSKKPNVNLDFQFTPEQVKTLTLKLNEWDKLTLSKMGEPNYQEKQSIKLQLESDIISILNDYIQNKSEAKEEPKSPEQQVEDKNVVPTVANFEGKKFKNVKTFSEMVGEAFMSPSTVFKTKAKSEIKQKVNNLKSKSETKPNADITQKSVADIKAEIANKMKQLDQMFKSDSETVAVKAEEVKQLLESINTLINKIK